MLNFLTAVAIGNSYWKYTIVHFLPVFGCLGDSAWNCIPTVYSVVMGSSFFSNQDFSAKGVVKGVCVCGVAPETTPEAEKSRFEQKRRSQDQGLNIGIQFHANSRSNQIWGRRFFCIPTPPSFRGRGLFRICPKK